MATIQFHVMKNASFMHFPFTNKRMLPKRETLDPYNSTSRTNSKNTYKTFPGGKNTMYYFQQK